MAYFGSRLGNFMSNRFGSDKENMFDVGMGREMLGDVWETHDTLCN
jgi:hypothetical protein